MMAILVDSVQAKVPQFFWRVLRALLFSRNRFFESWCYSCFFFGLQRQKGDISRTNDDHHANKQEEKNETVKDEKWNVKKYAMSFVLYSKENTFTYAI